MKIITLTQRSTEWLEARCGKVTSSSVGDALSFLSRKSKNGGPGDESGARKDYKARIVAEILTGRSLENFVSDAMRWGNDNEDFARAAYETTLEVDVERVGFVLHPEIDRAGASPDGIISTSGLLEIKAPNTTTHLGYIIADVVPEEYKPQMLWQMACCERDWCDFVSYDPRLTGDAEHLQLFVKRFKRDDALIAEMEKGVLRFLSEVDDLISRLPRQDGSRPDLIPILEQSIQQVSQ